ncbi:MAG: DUF1844 domain-containing protein [Terracidiphilus sp.]|jgi:hypothetical protein
MSETPKFTVIDRRKFKAEDEQENRQPAAPGPETPPELNTRPAGQGAQSAGPQLVANESRREAERGPSAAQAAGSGLEEEQELPPPPTAAESRQQKSAYDASSQRLEDLIRAQNPAMGALPSIGFEQLVQQFYVSAMIQMGAGAQEGQRPRVDILGARTTIDLLGVLADKTRGNLNEAEDRTLQTVLFELRMAFLELTSMITAQAMQPPPPPPPGKR